MGVTIHFEGQIRDQESYELLIAAAREFAKKNRWLSEPIDAENVVLKRVQNEKDLDYQGPVKGIVLYPHEDCDPFRLEFDRDLYIQEYIKTQFAGTAIHETVIRLFQIIKPYFKSFEVFDEGEFWETQDSTILEKHFQAFYRALDDELKKYPEAKVKVKLPSGRIVDLMT